MFKGAIAVLSGSVFVGTLVVLYGCYSLIGAIDLDLYLMDIQHWIRSQRVSTRHGTYLVYMEPPW